MTGRHHNTILVTEDTNLLDGVRVGLCPGGCGYLATNCGCPDSPRLRNGHAVKLSGRCGSCGYMLATHCTCPGGPRAGLV